MVVAYSPYCDPACNCSRVRNIYRRPLPRHPKSRGTGDRSRCYHTYDSTSCSAYWRISHQSWLPTRAADLAGGIGLCCVHVCQLCIGHPLQPVVLDLHCLVGMFDVCFDRRSRDYRLGGHQGGLHGTHACQSSEHLSGSDRRCFLFDVAQRSSSCFTYRDAASECER
jgi:hypothetical protein